MKNKITNAFILKFQLFGIKWNRITHRSYFLLSFFILFFLFSFVLPITNSFITEVEIEWYSLPFTFDFKATHPFYYAIVANKSDSLQPIFMGRYLNTVMPMATKAPTTTPRNRSQAPLVFRDEVPSSTQMAPSPPSQLHIVTRTDAPERQLPPVQIVTRTEMPETVQQPKISYQEPMVHSTRGRSRGYEYNLIITLN